MSDNLIRNIIIGVISAVVVTSGAILAISVIGNSKPDSNEDTAAIEKEPDNSSKSVQPNLKDIAKHYSGRTIPKEPLPESDLVHPQEILTSEITPPKDKPQEKIIDTPLPNELTKNPVLPNAGELPVIPIPDLLNPESIIPKSPPAVEPPILQSKKDNVELAQNTKKSPTENTVTPPLTTPIQDKKVKTKPTTAKNIPAQEVKKTEPTTNNTPTSPDNKITTPTTTTPPVSQNISVFLTSPIPPVSLPPPLWVYDYATGTIGVYYFSPVNRANTTTPTTITSTPNTTTSNNTTTQNNIPNPNNPIVSTPTFSPRLVSPFQLIPAPIPLSPVYFQPYQPIPIYPAPVYQPQPIVIFR